MSTWKRWLGLGVTAGVVGAALAGGAYQYLVRRPLPKTTGILSLAGLQEGVEITRDHWGVPHIVAQSAADLFFAQGFVTAQDRLWQMELNRRTGSGRLAELFGERALPADRFLRRIGLRRTARQEEARLDPETRSALEAYSQGVNACIQQQSGRLPLEFTLLRVTPEPWTPLDSLTWAKSMEWNLADNWEAELLRAQLLARLGPERAAKLESEYPAGNPLIVPPGTDYSGLQFNLLEYYSQIKELAGFTGWGGGSNSWVVDGTRTLTGKPILANDVHLSIRIPSIWYEIHLCGGGYDVAGSSLPGAPGVVIGHNQQIAWGITYGMADTQDLYIERRHPSDPLQFEYQGQWEQAEPLYERIVVKGRPAPIDEAVLVTRHGPIITTEEGQEPLHLALRWAAAEPGTLVKAVLHLDRATNWDEYRAALRLWTGAVQNFTYADTAGNIGYHLAGRIPIRRQGSGLVPVPGWNDTYEWTAYIPFDKLPSSYNPDSHFIVTANNKTTGDDYPYHLAHEYANGYRARRITDLIEEKSVLTVADCIAMQADVYSLPATQFIPHLQQIAPSTERIQWALTQLNKWDCRVTAESTAAAIYETTLYQLQRAVFGVVLGDMLDAFLGLGTTMLTPANSLTGRSMPLLLKLLAERDEGWWSQPGPERSGVQPSARGQSTLTTWAEALTRSLESALDELERLLGKDRRQWQWGRLHQLPVEHPLGQLKPLHLLFDRGPFPLGGDSHTVLQAAFIINRPYRVASWAPTYRQVVDLKNLLYSVCVHPGGQSGQPGSRHYSDQIQPWLRHSPHFMRFNRALIQANAEAVLRLQPVTSEKRTSLSYSS